ncbi:LapD/MoxY N-terminal periplasmic domain-containing protein [Paracoccus ravus]|uniref:LapD/MoxY N-terminal periplasmic domain-containing protein n=1 Tax=Paracoccus ravus TaxID=2447760 RepID=UPI00106EC079|nr:LapD/MoxY N-terminal periplasmic domain-containing protein [Paracoccus ravus]
MNATGQIAAGVTHGIAAPGRGLPLRRLVLGGSLLGWLVMLVMVATVLLSNARVSIREETASTFALAKAAATLRLPTAFQREDLMAAATALAIDIRAQRHVTAEIRDAAGEPLDLPPRPVTRRPAPEWFAALLRPTALRDVMPITQYPNLIGVLEIRSEPGDEIAEIWHDLQILLPLLAVSALAALGVTMAISGLVLRRLEQLTATLDRMRAGDLDCRAHRTGLSELDALSEGVNALAAHLSHERAEIRRLQARMMTLAETERSRIASDLHDEIGPQLFALHAAVGQAQRQEAGEELDEALAAIGRHSAAIRKSVRSAIDDLRLSPAEGTSLADMAQELLIGFQDMAPEVVFRLDAPAGLPAPDAAGQIATYRFIRESVLNALRHSGASEIEVTLSRHETSLVARVRDNGRGPSGAARRGLGQTGMRDRAAALGALWLPPRRESARTITEFRIACP